MYTPFVACSVYALSVTRCQVDDGTPIPREQKLPAERKDPSPFFPQQWVHSLTDLPVAPSMAEGPGCWETRRGSRQSKRTGRIGISFTLGPKTLRKRDFPVS